MTSRTEKVAPSATRASERRLGVLVLHGFTGSPETVRPLAESIAARGFEVALPLLPGHGTSPEDLSTMTYAEFLGGAEAAYDELKRRVDTVAVVGLSMGGALAAELALRHREIVGLVLINPFVEPAAPAFVALLEAAIAAGETSIPSIASDVAKPGARGFGYGETPLRPLVSLLCGITEMAPHLGDLAVPVLLFSSRTDHVVPTSTGDFLCSRVPGPVERVMLEHSYHVATLDHDAPELCVRTVSFLDKLVAP